MNVLLIEIRKKNFNIQITRPLVFQGLFGAYRNKHRLFFDGRIENVFIKTLKDRDRLIIIILTIKVTNGPVITKSR